MYLGIDVGGTKIQAAYMHRDRISLSKKIATPGDYATFLRALVELARETADPLEPLSSLGLGIPGTVTQRCITWVPNLPFLDGQNLAGDLAGTLGARVTIANDAQLALLGERWQGAARDRQSAALISVGTGVGGALMLDGKIVRGFHGSAGAFGWLNLDWHAPADPNHGYVELQASGRALEKLAQQNAPALTSHELIARAREGKLEGRQAVEQLGRLLGITLASIASMFDPEILIFSGGLADIFDLLEEHLKAGLYTFGSPSIRHTPIIASKLGKYAAAYGALRAAMQPESLQG
ncbi:ROK family protein [Ktedonosporobacter rubrisoli]|uniref:ROK family protein n=1 Tax=Ktedonosporobacter rubrisoli TaxID=2509675 RepID=A0A4P6JU01_KTERU|nr:ROK family protein [Ktedonosporobacter rubrisoli]QBD79089.1 ROK family protein [Ktedonosporobacter rubrisoli]